MIKRHPIGIDGSDKGLKYLCYTTLDNDNYNGSGRLWKEHLKEYGTAGIVSGLILESDNQKLMTNYAIYMSEELDIVDSKDWANLQIENCTHAWGGGKRAQETKDKLKKVAAEIKADPVRNTARSKNLSEASIKNQAAIKADPIRAASRSANLKKAAAEIKADPIRAASRSANMSGTYDKTNPVKSAAISKAHKDAKVCKRIPVSQYTMDGVFIEEFVSQEEARKSTGINPGGISSARRNFNRSAGGFRWK